MQGIDVEKKMEAEVGIEPASTALQAVFLLFNTVPCKYFSHIRTFWRFMCPTLPRPAALYTSAMLAGMQSHLPATDRRSCAGSGGQAVRAYNIFDLMLAL